MGEYIKHFKSLNTGKTGFRLLLKKIVLRLHKCSAIFFHCQDALMISSSVIQMLPLLLTFDVILTLHNTLSPLEQDVFGWIGGFLALFSVLYRQIYAVSNGQLPKHQSITISSYTPNANPPRSYILRPSFGDFQCLCVKGIP